MEATIEQTRVKQPNAVCRFLDRYFHIYERGSTVRSEIGAGIGAFLIACVSFIMTAQVIGEAYGNYAGSYLACVLVAFISTLLLGLLARRPLVQTSNMALATTLVATISAHEGLTWSNLMIILFFSSIINLAIVVSPLGKKLTTILPLSIRKALPIGVALFTMTFALEQSGLFTSTGLNGLSSLNLHGYYYILIIISVLAYIGMKAFKVKKTSFRLFGVLIGLMWAGGILFYMSSFIGGSTATTLVYHRLNMFFATDGASPYNIVLGFQSIKWADCFKTGFDFTNLVANGGNPAFVFIQGIIVFSCMSLYTNVSTLNAASTAGEYRTLELTCEEERRVHLITAGVNLLAPIIGAPIATVDPAASSAETSNEGKTGLSSVVTSIGFFICLFTWLFFAFFATETNAVGMWINDSEVKLAAYVQDVFAFNDIMMVLVSASMLKGLKDVRFESKDEIIPFSLTLIGMVVLRDFALGIALGFIGYAVAQLAKKNFKEFKPATIVFSALSLLYVIFAII